MSQHNEQTSLLAPRVRRRLICLFPYGIRLLLCLLCSLAPLIPDSAYQDLRPRYVTALQICIYVIPDFALDIFWQPLRHVLDETVFATINEAKESNQKKGIRKSDCLNTVLKAVVLKVLPAAISIMTSFKRAGFSWWSSIPLGITCPVAMGIVVYRLSKDMVHQVQSHKLRRDEAVEMLHPNPRETQDEYLQKLKDHDRWRGRRKVFWLTIFVILSCATADRNIAMTIKLGNQLRSLDETFDKAAQSLSRVVRILRLAEGNVISITSQACHAVSALGVHDQDPTGACFSSETDQGRTRRWRQVYNIV